MTNKDQVVEDAFWVVSPEGKLPPELRHSTPAAAVAVAEGMARDNPGVKFYVLVPTAAREASGMVQTEITAPKGGRHG
ncbi:DUF2188 domain-containing protein [Paraburkholderia sp. J10-1]|uniref:DUF2188 domain-containing protein n=1 Tax=Paraburkholderia sp. J10-1 TaxID=2805430 RepID=UPI002AB68EE3|nr:DUF2188 domain-containing protein [Paraburkholderia sp. J10-1]